MSDNDLIRRGDALKALHYDVGLGTAHPAYECIAALPAVTPALGLKHIGTGLYETQSDYRLAPHLQKIVDGAKTAPQWDTQADRLAPTDAAHLNGPAEAVTMSSTKQPCTWPTCRCFAKGQFCEAPVRWSPQHAPAAQAREAALPDFVTLLTDAAAVAMKARGAALRDAAEACRYDDAHDCREAILALIDGEART